MGKEVSDMDTKTQLLNHNLRELIINASNEILV